MRRYAEAQTPVAQEPVEDRFVVHELARRIADVSERVRARLKQVGEVDLVSQNVLIEAVRKLEKQQWMLRIQLEESA
jgi:DNA-binding ferritin-like protein